MLFLDYSPLVVLLIEKNIILTLANFITFLLLSTKITLKNLRAHVTLYSLANQLWHRNELDVSSFSFWSLVLPAFHCKQQAYPPWTDIADPERGLPLARHHPSSVGLYKYTIVLILYLFHPLRSFCSQGSSFYILAASAKQLMCTECVDSNCLAIVAPSRLALYTLAPVRTRGGGWWRIVVQSPRGFSVRFFLRFAINRLSLVPSAPETLRRSYIGNRNKRNVNQKIAINIYLDYIVIELTKDDISLMHFIITHIWLRWKLII